jgi:hypothetical protein
MCFDALPIVSRQMQDELTLCFQQAVTTPVTCIPSLAEKNRFQAESRKYRFRQLWLGVDMPTKTFNATLILEPTLEYEKAGAKLKEVFWCDGLGPFLLSVRVIKPRSTCDW